MSETKGLGLLKFFLGFHEQSVKERIERIEASSGEKLTLDQKSDLGLLTLDKMIQRELKPENTEVKK